MNWILKPFDDLTPKELYKILQLRNEVFIVEQNCPYQDCDNKDIYAWHLMGMMEDRLLAYSRLLAPGISYRESSIGRIVSSPSTRKTGMGKKTHAGKYRTDQKSFSNRYYSYWCSTISPKIL